MLSYWHLTLITYEFKNAADTDNGLIVTTDLAKGLFDWKPFYKLFDKTVDVALGIPNGKLTNKLPHK